jgi:hypothetical protein
MYKRKIISSLLKATLLVDSYVKGLISWDDFIKRYNNFYYFEALDGHEAGDKEMDVLRGLKKAIDLHRDIQKKAIDLVIPNDVKDRGVYLSAGRIADEEAGRRVSNLAFKHDLKEVLSFLESAKG